MTIRKALLWWFRSLWIGLMAIGILAGSWRPHSWFDYYLRMAVLSFLLISVIGIFAFGFVCPRCRSSLIMKATKVFNGPASECGKCGVSWDEPLRRNDNPA